MSNILKRIRDVCAEFDQRIYAAGLAVARLELAKALVECEEREKTIAELTKAKCFEAIKDISGWSCVTGEYSSEWVIEKEEAEEAIQEVKL